MADESDEEDYVVYGTPLQDEELAGVGRQGKQDPAAVRSLAVHQQEATDEQGRRRFHGAFTGGFSAGYYNTVGSKEGWQPSTFSSSRSAPAQRKQQSVEDFMDEDERDERQKTSLGLKADFDTFGATAAEAARSQAATAAAARPSIIPGTVPLEFFAPVSSSIGMQLLQKMGWRPGKGIGTTLAAAGTAAAACGSSSSSKWGTIGGISIENTPLYVLDPKEDLHGLGFDPFEGAEEFRSRKRQKESDTMGYMEDYVDTGADVMARKGQRQEVFAYEEASESDDDDRFDSSRHLPVAARIAAAQHQQDNKMILGKEQYTQHGSFIQGGPE
eukprot:gene10080-10235_t